MNIHTETVLMPGPAGTLELAIDRPATPRAGGGAAVGWHPHPRCGGPLRHQGGAGAGNAGGAGGGEVGRVHGACLLFQ